MHCLFCVVVTGKVLYANGGAQVALLGIQMIWTADCQEALDRISKERDRTIMAQTNKVFATMMADLVQCCLSDLGTRLNRTKYETLVTIHVHQVSCEQCSGISLQCRHVLATFLLKTGS